MEYFKIIRSSFKTQRDFQNIQIFPASLENWSSGSIRSTFARGTSTGTEWQLLPSDKPCTLQLDIPTAPYLCHTLSSHFSLPPWLSSEGMRLAFHCCGSCVDGPCLPGWSTVKARKLFPVSKTNAKAVLSGTHKSVVQNNENQMARKWLPIVFDLLCINKFTK